MKKIAFIFILLALSACVFGQGNYKVVQQQQAHYPGGDAALQDFVNRNITYTQEAYNHRAYGYVQLSFDVKADSTLSDIIVLKGMDYGISEEVTGLIKPLKFVPAMSNGVAFKSNVIISVNVKAIPTQTLEIEKK
jgi:periplasmic protein TonB